MGLGPPVCQHCQVVASFTDETGWYCKYCNETDLKENVWPGSDRWRQLWQNEQFLKFVNGENPNAST